MAAPTLMTRPWIGEAAAGPEARLLGRAMGGRDLALGIGTLRALGVDGAEARPWVALAGVADAVDATVTLCAFRRLPTPSRWAILAATLGAAVVSFRVAAALEPPLEPVGTGNAGVDPPADPVAPGGTGAGTAAGGTGTMCP
jgi:hypothetical protein